MSMDMLSPSEMYRSKVGRWLVVEDIRMAVKPPLISRLDRADHVGRGSGRPLDQEIAELPPRDAQAGGPQDVRHLPAAQGVPRVHVDPPRALLGGQAGQGA